MDYVVGGGALALAGVVVVLLYWATKDIRKMARQLAAAQQLATQTQAELNSCTNTLHASALDYQTAIAGRDRQVALLRKHIKELDDLIARHGGDELLVARLRRALSPALEAAVGDQD